MPRKGAKAETLPSDHKWNPPSVKEMDKLPSIQVSGENRIQTYLDWFDAHKELPRIVPPLYSDFTIRFTRSYFDPRKEREPRLYHYLECVHYYPGYTRFDVCHVLDGKKILVVSADYDQFNGQTMRGTVQAPATTKYSSEWLQNEGMSVLATVIAVQLYILHHKPDVEPVYLSAPATPRASHPRTSSSSPNRKIKNTVRKIIRLSAEDDAHDPIQRNYRKIQWQVRGHYRRLTGIDGKDRLVFVRPHTAHRGWKKSKPSPLALVDQPIVATNQRTKDGGQINGNENL